MKKKEIKFKPKKVKADSDKWNEIAEAILKSKHKDFSLITRLWNQITKKNLKDPEKEACKDLIKSMDKRKVSMEEAQQVAIENAKKLQTLQKDLPKILIFLLGGGTMLICAIVFLILRAPKTLDSKIFFTDVNVILWLIIISVNLYIFWLGLQKRKVFSDNLAKHSILSQAGAALAASKAPGRGGSLFEALNFLEIIRQKNKAAFDEKFSFKKK